MTPLLVAAGLLGLIVGSFLNVVIYRVPRGESVVRPRSHCPHCEAEIRPWHNVPVVSWIVLRGRCAACNERISLRYPLVELGTAALFVATAAHFGLTAVLPAYLYLAAIGVALACIDVDVKRLPDPIVLPSYLVGLALLVPAVVVSADWRSGLRALAAMAALGIFYFVIALVYPGGMGFGDVKLAGLLGLFLGWIDWGSVLVGTFTGFLLGGLVSAIMLATRKAGRKTAIPFGPFMLIGCAVALFAGGPIFDAYLSLLAPST